MEAIVAHIEISDFLITALERHRPYLRGRPFVISPLGAEQARVHAASRPARVMGVQRGMLLKEARKLDQRLLVHPMEEKFFRMVGGVFVQTVSRFSPVVEPWRQGQAYLALLQRWRNWHQAQDTVYRLRREIQSELALQPSVGLATNKLVSRAASMRSARQDDLIWVPPGEEAGFIQPFPVRLLPHVDRQVGLELRNLNIIRIRELTALTRLQLQELFGRTGWRIYNEARGVDPTPVLPPEKRPAFYEEWLFNPASNDAGELRNAIYMLLNRLARQLRDKQVVAGRIALSGTYADERFYMNWRNLHRNSAMEEDLQDSLQPMLDKLIARRVALKRVGIRVLNLKPAAQLELFSAPLQQKQQLLTMALDQIKARFGEDGVVWGWQAEEQKRLLAKIAERPGKSPDKTVG